MLNRSHDLLIVMLLALIAMSLTLAGVTVAGVRLIFGLLLALVLPGYALTAALFAQGKLGLAERGMFSIGLSIVTVALSGLVLNWTPWGLRVTAWAVLLGSLSLAASGIALVRRRRAGAEGWKLNPAHLKMSAGQGVLFALAALIAVAAVSLARTGAAEQHYPGFTQLWLLPVDQPGEIAVRVGVRNKESTVMRYKLQLEVRGAVVQEWSSVEVQSDGTWETTAPLPIELINLSGATHVQAVLYRLDRLPDVYRRVDLRYTLDWQGIGADQVP